MRNGGFICLPRGLCCRGQVHVSERSVNTIPAPQGRHRNTVSRERRSSPTRGRRAHPSLALGCHRPARSFLYLLGSLARDSARAPPGVGRVTNKNSLLVGCNNPRFQRFFCFSGSIGCVILYVLLLWSTHYDPRNNQPVKKTQETPAEGRAVLQQTRHRNDVLVVVLVR